MREIKISIVIASFIILLMLLSVVSAITASLGNSRMVLRLDKGESIEKSLLVKNVNDIPVMIELAASGDLKDSLVLKEQNFTLDAGKEKKAYFTVKATKEGTTETKINVKFTPEEGNSVGLTATVIVITDDGTSNNQDNSSESSTSDSALTGDIVKNSSSSSFSLLWILVIITAVLIIVLVILSIYANKRRQKEVVRSSITKPKKSVSKNE